MLTRLEVDGFKNLLDFTVDLGPYTCIAGVNASGKSNVFDAIQFLSLLADHTFMDAALLVRSTAGRSSDPRTLFWDDGSGHPSRPLQIAAEMIIPRTVEDDFGRLAEVTTTFVRYELVLTYEPPGANSLGQVGRIALLSESLKHINKGDAPSHLRWPHNAKKFRDNVILGRRSGIAYISTTEEDDIRVVNVHADGGSRGPSRKSPAENAPRTIISTTTQSDDPTILGVRREMQSWNLLALEPSALRSPDGPGSPSSVSPDGAHMPATLFRLAGTEGEDVYARVASETSALTDVRSVDVDFDVSRETLTLTAKVGSGPRLPARSLSDGTLRFLALCVLTADPEFTGLLCMEEPENGIHPGRITAMVDLMKNLAVDPNEAPSDDNPVRQVIVNTHSTIFVKCHDSDDLLFAMPTTVTVDGRQHTTVRLMPLANTWRALSSPTTLAKGAVVDYLWESDNSFHTVTK